MVTYRPAFNCGLIWVLCLLCFAFRGTWFKFRVWELLQSCLWFPEAPRVLYLIIGHEFRYCCDARKTRRQVAKFLSKWQINQSVTYGISAMLSRSVRTCFRLVHEKRTQTYTKTKKLQTQLSSLSPRAKPTEQQPFFGEVSANFCRYRVRAKDTCYILKVY
jgi:hypothetical protein